MNIDKEQISLILDALFHLDATQNSWTRWELEKARDEANKWYEENSEEIEKLLSSLHTQYQKKSK